MASQTNQFIADFHIHSRFSRATSKQLVPEYLDLWARYKGIKVVGTGDFTHPQWIAQLKEKLAPLGNGLFALKKEFLLKPDFQNFESQEKTPFFALTTEISNIYKKNGKVRKVHNVIFFPDLQAVERFNRRLQSMNFNLKADGRPILGLDSRNLLEMVLETSENAFFVPAHIWTPWFSVLGSKSGFDSISECFDDLAPHIHAVETGLSTNPPLNWMCPFLDPYTLLANSDAHSPEKLGRNANIFKTNTDYPAMLQAMKTGNPDKFGGTIDLFPQEGKYHFDGHRKCGIAWNPVQTLEHGGICPVCGKKVTLGVTYRIAQLSDRDDIEQRPNRLPFFSIIPLKEILSEIHGVGEKSKRINREYFKILQKSGSELDILLNLPVSEIEIAGGEILAEAIRRMRAGEIFIKEGFDGQYGQIKLFGEKEKPTPKSQVSMFLAEKSLEKNSERSLLGFDLQQYRLLKSQKGEKQPKRQKKNAENGLNTLQKAAVEHFEQPALVLAGPGTGKTRVLTRRIAFLVKEKAVDPASVLAITFTNKAAAEIAERQQKLLSTEQAQKLTITTFHALGYQILKQELGKEFSIIDDADKLFILTEKLGFPKRGAKKQIRSISALKQQLKQPDELTDTDTRKLFSAYQNFLEKNALLDLNDLLYRTVLLFRQQPEIAARYREKFQWVLIDEYQDINHAQYELIRLLMPTPQANIFAIGDPNQAIYGFRGANVQYIKNFQNDYPKATLYPLNTSYRCPDSILQASGGVIQQKALQGLESGLKIRISPQKSDKSEAEFVARTIENMMGGLRFFSIDSAVSQGEKADGIESLADFAVLCRLNSQMPALKEAFHNHSIPYQSIGEQAFFRTEPLLSLLNLLKVARKPENEFLWQKMRSQWNFLPQSAERLPDFLKKNSVKNSLKSLAAEFFPDIKNQHQTLWQRLLDRAESYASDFESFEKHISIGASADTFQPGTEQVSLMTLHAAKGLEFQTVFIVGCENRILPYSLFPGQTSDREEEKRLLYVGMTRAKRYLFLSHASKRHLNGKSYELQRSPFLNRIEKDLLEIEKSEYQRKDPKNDRQLSLF